MLPIVLLSASREGGFRCKKTIKVGEVEGTERYFLSPFSKQKADENISLKVTSLESTVNWEK